MARCTNSCLDFIDDERSLEILACFLQVLEKLRGSVQVTTLREHWLNNHSCHRPAFVDATLKNVPHCVQATLLLVLVVFLMICERVAQTGKRCCRPIERGHINFVDSFRMCACESPQSTAVEATREGQDGEMVCTTRRLVVHTARKFLFGEIRGCTIFCCTFL